MARVRFFLRQLSRNWAPLVLAALFLAVLFVQRNSRVGLHLGLPYVYLSDEPHYLVGLNSVLWDGDAELGNNYARTNLGKLDAGIHRAGQIMDHHTYVTTFTGEVLLQPELFGSFNAREDHDAAGRHRPRAKSIPANGLLPIEYSWHPTYPLFLLAPAFSLLPRSAVEPVLLVLISALTLLAAMRFRELCTALVPNRLYADLAMLATFGGTPVLYYSRALFPESIFVILLVLAWHSAATKQHWLFPGICLSLAAALKPPAALLAVPIILLLWSVKFRKAGAVFGLVCLGVAFAFFELRVLKGVFKSGTRVDPERIFNAACLTYMPWANLWSDRFGLLRFAPVVAIALPGWLPLARRFPREAGAILAGVVLNFGFACLIGFYGSSYGPRYLVPIIPLIGFGIIGLWFYPRLLRWPLMAGLVGLLAWSVAMNLRESLAL